MAQIGAGTTILTAANTYSGGTTISAGTLQLGDGGADGSILGDVLDNGTLAFNRSDVATFAGTISGSGGVAQIGTGTTILTGINTYSGGTTISAGTLQLGDGGADGSILGDVLDNGTLAFNRSDVATFAGTISGSGAVAQIGTGTTILTGSIPIAAARPFRPARCSSATAAPTAASSAPSSTTGRWPSTAPTLRPSPERSRGAAAWRRSAPARQS